MSNDCAFCATTGAVRCCVENDRLRAELAATQAREARLRSLLERAAEGETIMEDEARAALAEKPEGREGGT